MLQILPLGGVLEDTRYANDVYDDDKYVYIIQIYIYKCVYMYLCIYIYPHSAAANLAAGGCAGGHALRR